MQKLRLLFALISFIIAGSSLATDFRLVVNAPPNSLDKANTIRLHGLSFKEGDRIVAVTYGKGPEMFKVSTGTYDGGAILAKPGEAKGVAGRVSNSSAQAPHGAVFASLVNVNAPTAPVKKAVPTASGFAGFFTSQAGMMLLGGLAIVIALGIIFRPKPKDTIYVPLSKRRNVDEAIKEIIDRLDNIDAKQTDLVKKPPVLRSFAKQIAAFETRLGEMESQLRAVGAGQIKQGEGAITLAQAVNDFKARLEGAEKGISGLAGANESNLSQLKELCGKVDAMDAKVRENGARASDTILTLQKQDEELQSMLFVLQEGQQQVSNLAKSTNDDVAAIRSKTAALETVTSSVHRTIEGLAEQVNAVDAKVAEHAARKVEVPDPRPALEQLQAALSQVAADQRDTQAKLAEFTTQIQDLGARNYDEALADIQRKLDATAGPDYGQDLQAMAAALAALDAKAAQLQAGVAEAKPDEQVRAEVVAIRVEQAEAAAALHEKIADLSKRIDQREAILASLQSQVREQGEGAVSGADMLPAVADLRMAIEALSADHAKSVIALDSVSKAVLDLRAQTDAKAAELFQAVSSLPAPVSAAPSADPAMLDALKGLKAESDAKLAGLTDAVSKMAAANDARATELEQNLAAALKDRKEAPVAELKVVENVPAIQPPATAEEVELVVEEALEPVAEAAAPVAEEASQPELASEEESEVAAPAAWHCAGASAARQWSCQAGRPFAIEPSPEPLKPLTPTETATIDYEIGPLLVAGGRVVYGHGDTLRGFWPGKNPAAASLKAPLPTDAWRLASSDKYVFCVEEEAVEVVNVTSWSVHTRFTGKYVDQVMVDGAWVGLGKNDAGYTVDFRDNEGRPVGQPVALPKGSGTPVTMVALDDAIFVGTKEAGLIRVDLAGATLLDPGAPKGAELVSLAVFKRLLLTLIRVEGKDHVFLLDGKGNVQKGLALGFVHDLGHTVIIEDRLYLVDGQGAKVVTVNLKKMEIAGSVDLPGHKLVTFSGVNHAKQHALLMTVQDAGTAVGKVVLLDPADGQYATVCPVNHSHVDAVVSSGHIVLATSCSYQNMLRVFAMPVSTAKAKAA